MKNETTFPEPDYPLDCWPIDLGYHPAVIKAWFKRCMADFPVDTYIPTDKEHVVRIVTPEYEDVECWFEKWFSQFTTNPDKEET